MRPKPAVSFFLIKKKPKNQGLYAFSLSVTIVVYHATQAAPLVGCLRMAIGYTTALTDCAKTHNARNGPQRNSGSGFIFVILLALFLSRQNIFAAGAFFFRTFFVKKVPQRLFLLNGLCHRTVLLQQHNPCRCMLFSCYPTFG